MRILPLLALLLALASSVSATPVKRDADVIIVGGGLSGLSTAWELEKQGISTCVLEAGTAFGGRVSTATYGPGLQAELGLHEIWEKDPLFKYVQEFGIPLEPPGEPYSSVVIDGRLYPFIQDGGDAYLDTVFTREERAAYDAWLKKAEALYDAGGDVEALRARSFGDWVRSQGLPPKVAEFIRLAVECEIAMDWDGISAPYGIMQCRIFMHGTERCYHAQDGNRRVIQALVDRIRGTKILGARVTSVKRVATADGGTECEVRYLQDNVLHTARGRKVVVAVPYHLLHAIQMDPPLTPTQRKAVDTLVPGRYLVVHLILDKKANDLFRVDGHLPFPVLTRGPLGVVYGVVHEPPAEIAEEVFTLLVHGDWTRTYLQSQDEVRQNLVAELEKLWPGFGKYVRAAYFKDYHPAATPGWPVGRSSLDPLAASLREENVGLFLAGDYVYSSHADGAILSAQAVAKRLAKDLTHP